jgi:hypothetical protein
MGIITGDQHNTPMGRCNHSAEGGRSRPTDRAPQGRARCGSCAGARLPTSGNYVFEGAVSLTVFGSGGRFQTETLEKGDVGYIPQGYGHLIQNVGNEPCRVLIGFNSGIYEDIDLSEWIAGNPPDVLATNFGKPAAVFDKFPHKDVFITSKK